MRAFVSLAAVSLLLLAASPGDAMTPRRVASLNLCTDELVLLIADPGQIVSTTHLGRQAAETPLWRQARRYRSNDGSIGSVAALRPDLIVTMGGGGRDRLRIARRLGIEVIDLPFPNSLADVERSIVRLASALGREPAGSLWLDRLRALKASRPRSSHDALWLGGGGRTVPASGLAAEWMRLAGLRQRGLQGDLVSLEQLILDPPRVLLRSYYRSGQYSRAQRWLDHPLVRQPRGSVVLPTEGRLWTCMGPLLVKEILRLRQLLS